MTVTAPSCVYPPKVGIVDQDKSECQHTEALARRRAEHVHVTSSPSTWKQMHIYTFILRVGHDEPCVHVQWDINTAVESK